MSSLIKKNNNQFLLMKNSFDEFIKKAISVILEVRDKNYNSNYFNCSSNSDIINNKNSFSFSLDDSFNSNFSNNSTTIIYILEIYYVSKEEKILCEKWTFQFDSNFFSESKNSTFKLNTLLRSVYCISRMNPSYNLFFDDNNTFEYKLVGNRKQKFFNDSKVKVNIINIQNLSVEFINKKDIKKLEEEHFQQKHNGFVLIKIPINNKTNNRLSLNNNMIYHKRKKRLFSFEGKENENISDITNNNKNNNNSFQSDLNEIKNILSLKNKSNESSMKKLNTMDSSNNLDESYKLEFEILENENDF